MSEHATPLRIAEQEVQRLERMLRNRKARVADTERKLAAAKDRLKAAKHPHRSPSKASSSDV